jgi:hypothetical protein
MPTSHEYPRLSSRDESRRRRAKSIHGCDKADRAGLIPIEYRIVKVISSDRYQKLTGERSGCSTHRRGTPLKLMKYALWEHNVPSVYGPPQADFQL